MTLPRLIPLARVAAAAAAAVAVLVAGSGAPAAATPPARAALAQFACEHALDPANRSVSVQAVMRPLAGTTKLAVKFELLEKVTGSAPQTVVRAGDLGVWISPTNPTLGRLPGDVWRLEKAVLNLDPPATYQFRVTFRWTGARGRGLGTTVRLSRTCRVRELRPDLLVRSVTVSPITGHPAKELYTAVIANRGATGAGPFEVLFAPGDSSPPNTDTVSFLGAGQTRLLSFVGSPCDPAAPPTVTVDAASQIDDLDRTNNAMTVTCPSAGTA
jgi:hypothetical protein